MKKIFYMFTFYCISFLTAQTTLGDLNQDGEVNIMDIMRTLSIYLENPPPPTNYELNAADVNADSVIDMADVILEINYMNGILKDDCQEENEFMIPCDDNFAECCMDTTNHDFEWGIDTFGYPLSFLLDAAIVDENDIWVVGRITLDPPLFVRNAHWNGEEWEELTIADTNQVSHWGQSFFAFEPNDMWFGSNRPFHFNGEDWILYGSGGADGYPTELGHIDRIWGTSFDNMFFFNSTADVVHWNGTEFSLIETSTGSGDGWVVGSTFRDVWGKDENHIWAFSRGSTTAPIWYRPHTIQFFDGEEWNDLYYFDSYDGINGVLNPPLKNMWGFEDTLYVMSGYNATADTDGGLWKESIITGEGYFSAHDSIFINFTGSGLKGNHPNDIITVNWQGKYTHYNGEEWNHHTELAEYFGLGNIHCNGMAFKDDTVILYGFMFMNIDYPVFVAKGTRIN